MAELKAQMPEAFIGPFTIVFKADQIMEEDYYDERFCFFSENGLISVYTIDQRSNVSRFGDIAGIYNWDTVCKVIK